MTNTITIETTNRRGGCLEFGGICGRRIAYPLRDIAKVLEMSEPEAAQYLHGFTEEERGLLIVPGTDTRLADYLHFHQYPGRIRDAGTVIK